MVDVQISQGTTSQQEVEMERQDAEIKRLRARVTRYESTLQALRFLPRHMANTGSWHDETLHRIDDLIESAVRAALESDDAS